MPETICGCLRVSSSVIAGQSIVVVTMNGRYDLRLPQIRCKACEATWSPGVEDLIRNDYWPATSHYSTVYATDVLFSFKELKMAAPECLAKHFLECWINALFALAVGNITADSFRKSFLEWEAVRFKVDKLCQEDHFDCPACSPDMLAVSVDGNRKHYRFKSAARSEEKAIFDGVFIANNDDVARFVDYVSGRGVCGGQWSAARETSQKSSGKTDKEGLELAVCRHGVLLRALNMFRGEIFAYPLYLQKQMACKTVKFFAMDVACKYWPYLQRVTEKCPELQELLNMRPFLSVFHAKAHDFKCEVKWSGAYQEGAGSTLGKEVEQCNAFLSRIAVTTKHMSKAGRIDMLTIMAMRWNQQKFDNLASTLARRYRKATIAPQYQLHNLEAIKTDMDISDKQLERWIIDINEWAEEKYEKIFEASNTPEIIFFHGINKHISDLFISSSQQQHPQMMLMLPAELRSCWQMLREGPSVSIRIGMDAKDVPESAERSGRKKILNSVVEKYNTLVPNAEKLTFDTILSDEIVWPWQLTQGDSVDLRTKRKAFDIVMAVRRLEEEKKILIAEMNKHWKSLCTRADTLKQMSSKLSNVTSGEMWGLLPDGIRGLQSLMMKNKQASNSLAKHAKTCYVQVLTETEINFDSDSEEYHTSSDSEQD
ncbi:hypothetical protein DPX16_3287 [Anabarilius grahami]|uniref:CxC3 like cysteine cluster domain-containing protein n=1 Tax=Anabarilius grahami TaxID=495550 RepID=A0A3N0XQD7_ANAGA|nr:hypothetical protein DPX16_3287 [Anabarilius grahami]